MKRIIKLLSAFLSAAALLFSALPISSVASPAQTIELSFSEKENGNTVISLILPFADKLTAIDFSIALTSETAVIEGLSTENTDLADIIYDFDSLPEDSLNKEIFTFTTTEKPELINFSGFFLDSLTTTEGFHLCDIIISSEGKFTENDLFRFSFTLSTEADSRSESHTYSLLTKALIEEEISHTFPSGDADLNGKIDASDARHILRASVGLDTLTLEQAPYADSDGDGEITATDARFSLRLSVGLEESVMHSFDISLEENKTCEEGGVYTFTCSITGTTFTMDIENVGHICYDSPDCLSSVKCEVCDKEIYPATGHNFDENGLCTECCANQVHLEEATAELISLLEEINTCDTLADDALSQGKRLDFISYTHRATKSIKKAAAVCEGVIALEMVQEHLMTAYSIRFQAFISVTDDNGEILPLTGNCNTILSAVKESDSHIDYASYLYT